MESVIEDKDLPERMKKTVLHIKQLAQHEMTVKWNNLIHEINKSQKQIDGNTLLTFTGNYLIQFAGHWLSSMIAIAKAGDVELTANDIVKNTFNIIAEGLGGKLDYREEKLPDGIKRLNE